MKLFGQPTIYEKIVDNFRRDIALGIYRKGDRLPSCRTIAFELGINPNTVQHAYTTLEKMGLVYSIEKKGVFVNGKPNRLEEAEIQVQRLKDAGFSKEDILTVVDLIYSKEE